MKILAPQVSGIILDHLDDVDTTTASPTDGQSLVYQAGTGKWKPFTVTGGGGGGTLLENGFVLRLSTAGNGTDTYTLDAAAEKVLVFIDGILQYDYYQPNGTNQLILGFVPRNDEMLSVYEFNTAAPAVAAIAEPLTPFLLMGA